MRQSSRVNHRLENSPTPWGMKPHIRGFCSPRCGGISGGAKRHDTSVIYQWYFYVKHSEKYHCFNLLACSILNALDRRRMILWHFFRRKWVHGTSFFDSLAMYCGYRMFPSANELYRMFLSANELQPPHVLKPILTFPKGRNKLLWFCQRQWDASYPWILITLW